MTRRLWLSWILLGVLLVVGLTIAASGGPAPGSNAERVYEIGGRLDCPQCVGQSVAESDAPIARQIRAEIAVLVEEGLTDDEITDRIAAGYEEDIRLEPSRSGVTGLVWVIPGLALGAAAVGLALVFRRWSHETSSPVATPDETVPRSRRGGVAWPTAAWIGGIAAIVLLGGFLLWRSTGDRDPGETATGGVRDSTTSLLAEAEACVADDDLDCAMEAYAEVLATDPENVEALTYQAAVLFREGEVEQALGQLDEAVAVDPTFLDAWGFKVVILSESGRTDEVLAELSDLSAGGDDDIAVSVAEQLFSAGEAVLSLQVYDAVLEALPDQARALAYRGWVVATVALDETLGDRDRDELQGQALTYLDRAVEAAPDLPDARAFRAIVLKRLGRTDEAAAELRAFDATDPPPEMQAIVDASGLREELGVPAPAEDP